MISHFSLDVKDEQLYFTYLKNNNNKKQNKTRTNPSKEKKIRELLNQFEYFDLNFYSKTKTNHFD